MTSFRSEDNDNPSLERVNAPILELKNAIMKQIVLINEMGVMMLNKIKGKNLAQLPFNTWGNSIKKTCVKNTEKIEAIKAQKKQKIRFLWMHNVLPQSGG